jgi:parallel beta-helix repeat protein
MRRAWPVALLLLLASTGPAEAAEGCLFHLSADGLTWTLEADCTVDRSIVLPDGVTLDGAQHTITAIDPPEGPFRGAIIANGGMTASVTNTVISAVLLANICQEGGDRLRAIYFDGASGAIHGNSILNVNKGASACQEGNAIELRNIDLTGPATVVDVSGNLIEGFQKTGIVVSGNVDTGIRANSIGASATQRQMVTNGIQVGAGARASIEGNTIAGNSWPGDAAAATAILLLNAAPGTLVRGNVISGNADVGIYVMADGVRVERNRLTDSGADGAFDVGIGNYGQGNVFEGNSITGFSFRYQNVSEPDPTSPNATVAAR